MNQPPSGFDGELFDSPLSARSPVLDVVASLLAHQKSGEALRVLELGEHFATLMMRSGRFVRVFRAPGSGSLNALQELIEQTVKHNPTTGTEVVIVGGGQAESAVIEAAVPKMMMHPFTVYQRTDDGDVVVWPQGKGKDRKKALEATRKLGPDERRALLSEVSAHAERLHEERKERARFFRGISGRAPRATYIILATILSMYGLQLLWQPQTANEALETVFLATMGGLHPPSVAEGQWYRLISVGFLHGGLMHVGINSFVLYMLGGQVERVLGTHRFIVLYTASLLGGSIASYFFLTGAAVSVGASGAIWGLLGAQVALAYGRPPVLPRSLAESMRPLAKQNLLLNVGISFLPGIDAAAHFGGGLAGGILLASGVLYRSSASSPSADEPLASRPIRGTPEWVSSVATLCVLIGAYALIQALAQGQPWLFAEEFRRSFP